MAVSKLEGGLCWRDQKLVIVSGGGLVLVQHHGRQPAAGSVCHRPRPGADGHQPPVAGRVPDPEGGGLGHLQPHDIGQQTAGRLPRPAGRHTAVLQVRILAS